MPIILNATAAARHAAKCAPSPSGCLLWTGALSPQGYGVFRPGGAGTTMQSAHRVAYVLGGGGQIEPKDFICHTCDTPACQRFDHLFKGDHLANMEDMRLKGRSTRGRSTPYETRPRGLQHGLIKHPERAARGTANGAARLTAEQVYEIRAQAGVVSQRELARLYGVTQGAISSIVRRRHWAHLEPRS